ncbi:MAG: D-alanyl-D-alanine carboxypeptidase family protein [Chthoniobacteraceae bacterium]
MTRRLLTLSLACVFALAPMAPAASKKSSPRKSTSSSAKAKTARPEPYAAIDPNVVPSIKAGSAILIDADTGRVLHEVNADKERPVASTQKLMTALLVAEEGGLDGRVKIVSSDTWAEPSKLYIKAGETYRRGDLLKILLVKSMNDVARALARDNAGSVSTFAQKMNQRARDLGMGSSHFVNPHGLTEPGQFSTARDMAKLARVVYRNPTIRDLVRLKEISWRHPSGKVSTYKNTNRVLRNYAFCNGMKTGYTEASGFCLISSASNGGRSVIAIVLGDTRDAIWTDSYKLLAWGLAS